MSRVALITIHSVPNYGSVLQLYATVRMLEANGVECDVIDYRFPNTWHHRHGIPRTSVTRHLVTSVATPLLEWAGVRSHHVLSRRLSRFKRSRLHFIGPFDTLDDLEQADWTAYDAVIAGSDQIWNPRFVLGDKAFMLSFVPDGVKKISIASSIASPEIPSGLRDKYRGLLERFDSITVRENGATVLINNLLDGDKAPAVVLDPTLLLTRAQWLDMAGDAINRVPSRPYILYYGLFYAFEARPYIFDILADMQRRTGMDIISVGPWPDPKAPRGLRVKNRRDVTPEEFVALVSRAYTVVTTSFHGTAFALNFGRPLVSVVPADTAGDDRQSSLLRLVGVNQAIVPVGTPVSDIRPAYDPEAASARLASLRHQSITLILNSI